MEKIRKLFAIAEIQFWKLAIRLMKHKTTLHWSPIARNIAVLAGVLVLAAGMFYYIPMISQSKSPDPNADGAAAQTRLIFPQKPVQLLFNETLDSDQTNVLIILVDSLEKQSPSLKGVWLAGKISSQPQIVFLPLYPSNREDESKKYEDMVALSPDQKPAEQFSEFLQTNEISWSHYLILDETSLVELSSLISRGSTDSQAVITPTVISAMLNNPDTATGKIKAQAFLASSLCESAPDLIRNADPTILWNLLIHRMRSDFELQTVKSAQHALAEPGNNPICEFPTLRELTFFTENH